MKRCTPLPCRASRTSRGTPSCGGARSRPASSVSARPDISSGVVGNHIWCSGGRPSRGGAVSGSPELDPRDVRTVEEQLGRTPRAIRRVAHRCGCGLPDVVETFPRLADGTPFPTLYYLTCPRAAKEIS